MSASLVWQVSSSDGGRPITHYTVEQKGKFDIDFVKAVDTEGKELELPAVRRTQPTTKKAKISSTTHVQMLQWFYGKQQQQLFIMK